DCLKGPAFNKLALYQASAENYAHAWKTLIDEYEKHRILVAKHYDGILDIPMTGINIGTEEKIATEWKIIKIIQGDCFGGEIENVLKCKQIKGSRLAALNPFIDEYGLLRVGGRLQNATIEEEHRHPILLPSYQHVTDLIIRNYHLRLHHAGIQTTLTNIRHRFWLLDGKNQVRKIIRRCVTCFRHHPVPIQSKMGNLPSSKVREAYAFEHTGVDYFGPIFIKEKKFRNRTRVKAYGCVFICMATKAVHIEIVSNLTTDGFLGALRRFIGRRARPAHIYSDNGTNFVGANNQWRELHCLLNSEQFHNEIKIFSPQKNITWHFNPPLSPHFGGIWEAAVKSFKHHFKRVIEPAGADDGQEVRRAELDGACPALVAADASSHNGEGDYDENNRRSFALQGKDARLPSPAEFVTGTVEDKLERMDGLIQGLGKFIENKSNLHKEVISYQLSLGMAFSALVKSLGSQVPPRPPVADKAICTSPLFTGSTMSKRPADASPEMRVPPKRSAGFSGPIQTDQNNNVAEDCDDYVLVDKRRRQRRKPQPQMPINVLQLKKGVDNASDLGEELGKVLGTTATASALQHTSMIEIKDLDESVTKEEITMALDALLGVPVSRRDPVKSLRKAYAGTQVAVVALPDDLAATALKLGHVRIGWVHGGIPVQERPARIHPYFAWARIGGIFFFSVYAPPRLSEREFSALLANITEEARGRRPLVIAGDFNAWSTEWGCRKTRPRAPILLDSLALLDAVLLNTGDVPTFNGRQGSSIVDLTFVCETLAPRVKSWTVSGRYTHSDHQAIFFEIEDTGTSTRPSMRQSCKWNARTLDAGRFSATVSSASVAPGTAEDMASSLMSVITGAYSSRDRGAGMTTKPTARTTPQQGVFCAWRSRPAKRRCWRQLCDEVNNDVWGKPYRIAMSRLGCPQAKQPSSPLLVRGAVAALFPRVPSGPALRLPRRAEEPIPAVTLEELKGAQSRIKERSAPGPDGIPNSALKIAVAARPDIFLRVYTTCLETGVFSSSWKRLRLFLLPKPGKPPDEPSSFRPLCMLDTAGKILERIICDRLKVFTERPGGLSERQYGFRKGRSTIDAIEDVISTVREAIAGKRWYRGTKKYCAMVTLDVRNAFNSARWDNILAALRRLLVPDYLLRIIASYFSARVLDFTTDEGPESYEFPEELWFSLLPPPPRCRKHTLGCHQTPPNPDACRPPPPEAIEAGE
ncbi:unnamed protein product, partial [Trichogramma brassicae]